MAKVNVRIPPHVAVMLNAGSSGWLVIQEELKGRMTVSDLLFSLVLTYPGFRETVYNPDVGVVNEQIGIILNDKLLAFEEISRTMLKENDSITILPLYYGG